MVAQLVKTSWLWRNNYCVLRWSCLLLVSLVRHWYSSVVNGHQEHWGIQKREDVLVIWMVCEWLSDTFISAFPSCCTA